MSCIPDLMSEHFSWPATGLLLLIAGICAFLHQAKYTSACVVAALALGMMPAGSTASRSTLFTRRSRDPHHSRARPGNAPTPRQASPRSSDCFMCVVCATPHARLHLFLSLSLSLSLSLCVCISPSMQAGARVCVDRCTCTLMRARASARVLRMAAGCTAMAHFQVVLGYKTQRLCGGVCVD